MLLPPIHFRERRLLYCVDVAEPRFKLRTWHPPRRSSGGLPQDARYPAFASRRAVGLRFALAHPERIGAIISQNGNAYEEGLSQGWNPIQK
jgi:hypothetical protein